MTSTLQPDATRPDAMHEETSGNPSIYLPVSEIGMAMRKTWLIFIGLALVPPAAMIASIFFLIWDGGNMMRSFGGVGWLVVGMVWISVTVPLAFYIRRQLWIDWFKGDGVVSPENYVKGNVIVWAPMVIGGVMGFVGMALTAGPASLFTSITALVLFISQAPDGSALTKPVGDHDDPAVFEHPN